MMPTPIHLHHARARVQPGRGTRRRAFTVIELLVAIVVIALLLSILAYGLRLGFRSARAQADATAIASLKTSLTQFNQTLGFFPPLVRDNRYPSGATNLPPLTGGPVAPVPIAAGSRPVVVALSSDLTPAQAASMQRFLSHRDSSGQPLTGADWRFSNYSLAYYVIGALPAVVDGVDGPGARAARRDGGFESAGRTLDPFFDLSRNTRALYTEDLATGRVELRDSGGTPIRYYRWLRGRFDPSTQQFDGRVLESADANIPRIFWNGASPADAPPEARDAEFAILAAGRDGVFGDEVELGILTAAQLAGRLGVSGDTEPARLRELARRDNIVEFGR